MVSTTIFFCLLGLLQAVPIFNTTNGYDEAEAYLSVKYCGAAYCFGHGLKDWSCGVCKTLPPLTNIVELHDGPTNVNGFVGFDAAAQSIIVAFAGTDPLSIKNWIDDLNFFQTKYPACVNCLVHEGFYDGFLKVQSAMHTAVSSILTQHPSASIRVSGHSLGGALANLAALDLIQNKLAGDNLLPVYTFGEPRVGEKNFAAYSKSTLGELWRVTHNHDPVPHLPLEAMNFHHVPTEVFYNELQTSHKICDGSGEDSTCSDKYLTDLDLLDHLNYLSFDFTANYLKCKL